ncbi:MAG TPA: hypothetical protein VN704_08085 [Verrucomicrobiae bacterium]|nr:hypothetical protein [Verrucomicrobiae bacterium]
MSATPSFVATNTNNKIDLTLQIFVTNSKGVSSNPSSAIIIVTLSSYLILTSRNSNLITNSNFNRFNNIRFLNHNNIII